MQASLKVPSAAADGSRKRSKHFQHLQDLINGNQPPGAEDHAKLSNLSSQELQVLRKKVSDAKANNLPEHLLNRVKRKWSYQDRKDCLDTWHDTLDPKNLAKLFRVATSKQQIFFESVSMGLDDKHDDISNLSFFKLIQLIGTSVPESHKLEAFRKNLAAFSGLGL